MKKPKQLIKTVTNLLWQPVNTPPEVAVDGYYPLRSWQQNAFDELQNETYSIINAPTGSGKSHMMLVLSVHKMLADDNLRTIIAVPQTIIAQGFRDAKVLLPDGKKHHWVVGNNLCDDSETPSEGTIKALISFLTNPSSSFSDRSLLCSHATLVFTYQRLKAKGRLSLFKNLNVWIDEAHHLKNQELLNLPDTLISNGIGEFVSYVINNGGNHVSLATASFYRGDRRSLLTDKQEEGFVRYNLPYDTWLKTMRHLRGLKVNFVFGGSDYTKTIGNILEKHRRKDIIYIPTPTSKNSTGCKYREVDRIISEYQKIHGGKPTRSSNGLTVLGDKKNPFKVLNLVDETDRDTKKTFVNETLKASTDLDAIIALGMFKEGANWPHADRAIIVGQRESMVEMLQIVGRLFRDVEGKEVVEVFVVLPFGVEQVEDEETLKENLNNSLKALFSCMLLENIFSPIKIFDPTTNASSRGIRYSKPNPLNAIIPDVSKQLSLLEDVAKHLIVVAADAEETGEIVPWHDVFVTSLPTILSDYGIVDAVEIVGIGEVLWRTLARKSLTMKGIDTNDLDYDLLVDVNPLDCINGFTTDVCGVSTFQGLRDALALLNNADKNKKELLRMAKEGKPRPHWKSKMSGRLSYYIGESGSSCDKAFSKEIKKAAPQWFIDTAAVNKKELLRMAKEGKEKPHSSKTKIGGAMVSYINKSCHHTYDESFTKEIKKAAPQWFIVSSEVNKKELLRMANDVGNRPRRKTKLGDALSSYMDKSGGSYDESFSKEIKKTAPHWFIDTVAVNKKELLRMAKAGGEKPQIKNKLGAVLPTYINKSQGCYDESFSKEIRELRPDWFIVSSEVNKKELLRMAKEGKEKPRNKAKLSGALSSYISESGDCYDESFSKEIKKAAPQWFIDYNLETRNKNKKELLRMAKEGKERPSAWTTELGKALVRYTNKSQDGYDQSFSKEIRELRPDWFSKKAVTT